jgi:transcription initiation factor TFIID TATA-box-binding protein
METYEACCSRQMVTMKLRRPYTTASIWSSGKVTVTGATTEACAHLAARRIARMLQSIGFRTRFSNYRVVNVLGSCTMPFNIKIAPFSEQYRQEARYVLVCVHGNTIFMMFVFYSYEPELHPGVTFRIKEPHRATLKIFSTGSITITGGE